MRNERGSSTVEMVVIAPVLVLLMLFVVGCGRWVQAGMSARDAADQAARSASMVSAGRMERVALAQVSRHLSRGSSACTGPRASVELRRSGLTSNVHVTVRCRVDMSGLTGLFGLPRTVTASSSEVIDVFTFR